MAVPLDHRPSLFQPGKGLKVPGTFCGLFCGLWNLLRPCSKVLEKDQSRGGFTSLLLSFGALLSDTTVETIQSALAHSHTQDVWTWCREKLGTTVFAKRQLAFKSGATKLG